MPTLTVIVVPARVHTSPATRHDAAHLSAPLYADHTFCQLHAILANNSFLPTDCVSNPASKYYWCVGGVVVVVGG